jgi:hypothetical protein
MRSGERGFNAFDGLERGLLRTFEGLDITLDGESMAEAVAYLVSRKENVPDLGMTVCRGRKRVVEGKNKSRQLWRCSVDPYR